MQPILANVVVDLFLKGGPIMYPLLIAAVVAVAVAGERLLWWFRQASRRDEALVAKVREVAGVLESNGWKVPCDAAFKGDFRGGFKGEHFRDVVRYLHMLHATYEMTGDAVWRKGQKVVLLQAS
mgnify:CR=1 FL=1